MLRVTPLRTTIEHIGSVLDLQSFRREAIYGPDIGLNVRDSIDVRPTSAVTAGSMGVQIHGHCKSSRGKIASRLVGSGAGETLRTALKMDRRHHGIGVMRGERAISERRLRSAWLAGAGAIVLLSSTVFGDHVQAANWSHPGVTAHAVSTAPVVTTTPVTVGATITAPLPALTVTSATASSLATTTTTTTVSANGATTTATVTRYNSLTDINVSGTYNSVPFSLTFPTLASALNTAGQNGIPLSVTNSSATNTITISGPLPTGAIATAAVAFPAVSSSASTPALAAATPLTPSQGPPPLAVAEGSPAASVSDVEADAQAAASEAQVEIARCSNQTPPCIANALEAYAAHLEKIAPQLPPKLRTLPAIIRRAARNVRAAKTAAQAVRAVQAAIVQVRHTVELLRAEDPDARAIGQAVGGEAVGVLQAASNKLERATEL